MSWVQFPTSVQSALTAETWHEHRCFRNPFSSRCFMCPYSEPCFPLFFFFFPFQLLKSYILHCFLFIQRYKHQNWIQPPGNHWITAKYRRHGISVEVIHLLWILLLQLPLCPVFNLFYNVMFIAFQFNSLIKITHEPKPNVLYMSKYTGTIQWFLVIITDQIRDLIKNEMTSIYFYKPCCL